MSDTTTYDRVFDLRLTNGKVVQWTGKSGEDASRRYVDCVQPNVGVVAFRLADDGIHVLGRRGRIIG